MIQPLHVGKHGLGSARAPDTVQRWIPIGEAWIGQGLPKTNPQTPAFLLCFFTTSQTSPP